MRASGSEKDVGDMVINLSLCVNEWRCEISEIPGQATGANRHGIARTPEGIHHTLERVRCNHRPPENCGGRLLLDAQFLFAFFLYAQRQISRRVGLPGAGVAPTRFIHRQAVQDGWDASSAGTQRLS